jgi:predicted nuclease of restriction endonuclease-like RecB superfamily
MKAKLTQYNGVYFRSRLEVKWAQFFENLGVHFEYEPDTVETSLGWYIPDFKFRSQKLLSK